MVRSRAAGPAPSSAQHPPDYFTSLSSLHSYFEDPPPRSSGAPQVPYTPRTVPGKNEGKVLVCHDYKGGYTEKDDERGYTFQHWESIDTFIYFSHNRVSCPPPAWIRTAHSHGVKMLGTLIFEWDAGREDIVELVSPSSSFSSSSSSTSTSTSTDVSVAAERFSRISTRYADYLVDLAVERGFEGWFINVEVDLGMGERKEFAREHAAALVEWVRYLRVKMHERIEGAEVMWYDSVTKDGKLAWQNQINDSNAAFFDAADSLFANYWWRPEQLKSTASVVHRLSPSLGKSKDVYFGIDVFGRGTYAGGGFESWRALQAIRAPEASLPPSNTSLVAYQPPAPFSTALFAPGWSVEAESLGHSLTTPSAYARWLADDTYLWSHGSPTPSVAIESARLSKERKEQRGVRRARELAASTAPTASPLPLPYRQVPPFVYDAPLEPLPGGTTPKPLSSFLPSPRPVPVLRSRPFHTNFSVGSGHHFFVGGKKVLDASAGKAWTDVAFAFPQPSLLFHASTEKEREEKGVEASWVEDEAWEGTRALQLSVGEAKGSEVGIVVVPLCSLEVVLDASPTFDASIVWKVTGGDDSAPPSLPVVPTLGTSQDVEDVLAVESDVANVALHNGWTRTTSRIRLSTAASPIAVFSFDVRLPPHSSIIVGTLSLSPRTLEPARTPSLSNLRYSPSQQVLRWTIDHSIPAPQPVGVSSYPSSTFSHFHVFISRRRGDGQDATYLGTTFATEFAVEGSLLREAGGAVVEVVVQGVREDGRVGTVEEGGTVRAVVDV